MKAAALGLVLLLASSACDDAKQSGASASSRVVAVTARKESDPIGALCDVRFAADKAPAFSLPPLSGAAPELQGARWINVWATWCPPCIEELPLITRAAAELRASGVKLSLSLLSVDASDALVTTFAKQHPEAAGSLRVAAADALEPWLVSLGLDRGATLPLHVFVDAAGKVRCARTGAVGESDIATIGALLRAP